MKILLFGGWHLVEDLGGLYDKIKATGEEVTPLAVHMSPAYIKGDVVSRVLNYNPSKPQADQQFKIVDNSGNAKYVGFEEYFLYVGQIFFRYDEYSKTRVNAATRKRITAIDSSIRNLGAKRENKELLPKLIEELTGYVKELIEIQKKFFNDVKSFFEPVERFEGNFRSKGKDITIEEAKNILKQNYDVYIYVTDEVDLIHGEAGWQFLNTNNLSKINAKQKYVVGIPKVNPSNTLQFPPYTSSQLGNQYYYNSLNLFRNGVINQRIPLAHEIKESQKDFISYCYVDNYQPEASTEPDRNQIYLLNDANKATFTDYVFKSIDKVIAINRAISLGKAVTAGQGGLGYKEPVAQNPESPTEAPPVDTETEEQRRIREEKIIAASTIRINEQAALMINAPELITGKPKTKSGKEFEPASNRNYVNFVTYRSNTGSGGHVDFSKNVFKTPDLNYLLKDIPPHVLSALTPAIKIFKVFYPKKNMFSPNSEGFSWRIPFDEIPVPFDKRTSSFIPGKQEEALQEILDGESRLHGVGIKSFRYKYVGTNPAEVNSYIDADLELYMQDVRDIVKQVPIEPMKQNFVNTNPGDWVKNLKFTYCDLIADVPAFNKEVYNTDYYRIKIMVGYSIPPDSYLLKLVGDDVNIRDTIKKALKKATLYLYLNPYNHDLTFEENGSITLKIKYTAAVTTQTSILNCLEIAEDSYSKLKKAQKELDDAAQETREEIERIRLNCLGLSKRELEASESKTREVYEDLIEAEKTDLELRKNELYTEVFSRLTGVRGGGGGKPTGRVFLAVFNAEALGLTKSGELSREQRKAYENLGILKKLEGFELTSIEQTDPSAVLLNPAPPVPVSNPSSEAPAANAPPPDNRSSYQKALERADELRVREPKQLKTIARTFQLSSSETKKFIQEVRNKPLPPQERQQEQKEPDKSSKPDGKTSEKAQEALVKASEQASLNSSTLAPMTGVYEGKFGVKFVFLGDIFDVFCEVIQNIKYDQDRPKIVLNEFSLEIPSSFKNESIQYKAFKFNIADIPISLDMLRHFLMERVIKPRASSYNLFTLLTDILTDIVTSSVSPRYFGTKSVLNRSIRVSLLGAALPSGPNGEDLIAHRGSTERFGGNITSINNNIVESISIDNEQEIKNYLILYVSNQLPEIIRINNGDIQKDEEAGIYHFYIGATKGIIKSISFKRTNTPFYKEMKNASSHGLSSLGRLQEVYDVDVTMFGNNIYRPGDFIYIEPLFFSGKVAVDLQQKIGLGGYYQVIDVETTINVGTYETKLSAVLFGRIQDGNVRALTEDRTCGE